MSQIIIVITCTMIYISYRSYETILANILEYICYFAIYRHDHQFLSCCKRFNSSNQRKIS